MNFRTIKTILNQIRKVKFGSIWADFKGVMEELSHYTNVVFKYSKSVFRGNKKPWSAYCGCFDSMTNSTARLLSGPVKKGPATAFAEWCRSLNGSKALAGVARWTAKSLKNFGELSTMKKFLVMADSYMVIDLSLAAYDLFEGEGVTNDKIAQGISDGIVSANQVPGLQYLQQQHERKAHFQETDVKGRPLSSILGGDDAFGNFCGLDVFGKKRVLSGTANLLRCMLSNLTGSPESSLILMLQLFFSDHLSQNYDEIDFSRVTPSTDMVDLFSNVQSSLYDWQMTPIDTPGVRESFGMYSMDDLMRLKALHPRWASILSKLNEDGNLPDSFLPMVHGDDILWDSKSFSKSEALGRGESMGIL